MYNFLSLAFPYSFVYIHVMSVMSHTPIQSGHWPFAIVVPATETRSTIGWL